MLKISFIIPFYNGGKYISECLDSLFTQDIPETEYEVIVVDDCSTQTSDLKLLEEYSKRHPTLRIIHNERNLRCGGSRNHGLREAVGEYIWFVDQDDYIQSDCLNYILSLCQAKKLDILYFDYRDVSDDRSINQKRNVVSVKSEVKSGLDYIKEDCNGDFWHAGYDTNVWHAVYRRQFMLENKIFSPEVSYCEDMIVAQHAIIVAKKIMAIPNHYYCYRYNPASVFHTEVGVKGRPMFDASIYAGSEIIKLSELIPSSYKDLQHIVRSGGVHRLNSFTKSILKAKSKERKTFLEMVTKYADVVTCAQSYLTPINKWIITHPKYVCLWPHIIYAYIKICKKQY